MDYFIGSIVLFPYNFIPMGWLPCNGQELQVNQGQNQILFSLIGFNFGGNGTTTFKLPNLQGAEPIPNTKYYICMEGIYPPRS
jgi:microcystin-dependent protein